MLADVITRGTGQRALALGRRDLAGKTGTTNDAKDTWFNGFTRDLVATVWVGFDQERSLGEREEGGRTALPIWVHFMQRGAAGRAAAQPADAGGAGAGAHLAVSAARSPASTIRRRSSRRSWRTGCRRAACSAAARALRRRHAGGARRRRRHAGRSGRLVGLGAAVLMGRKLPPRQEENLRRALAQEAARVMAEHGVRDFLFAKRKAAERFGVVDGSVLPRNTEIEEALAEYQRLFGGDDHVESLLAQRLAAVEAMRWLREFQPRLVGPVLHGTATAAQRRAAARVRGSRRDRRVPADGPRRALRSRREAPEAERGSRARAAVAAVRDRRAGDRGGGVPGRRDPPGAGRARWTASRCGAPTSPRSRR